ncbi:hypothetical protein ATI02_5965 [Pseudomonas baetica]|uniref:Uncharacterized protein n=1 Tax=Pseudomonas baetica TaxID=674054 RepID=A0ABX4Q7T5_9PSED|nr:hypothetical protein [Pseudomonas baetica]PKA72864.1 hypothetical protein ATI02_5965 [Pseudomonas baetica]PTC19019.1 hypothetical protein C0J26_11295 [Pseudomonas baetica]
MTINNRCLVASAAVGELLSVVTKTERSLSRYFNDVGYLGMHCVFDDIAHQMITTLEENLTEVKRLIAETQERLKFQSERRTLSPRNRREENATSY